jgi:uncharacterized protein
MTGDAQRDYRPALARLLANGLVAPPPATLRHVYGRITFPGKATAVIGMRRAGKTVFLHQQRHERHAAGVPWSRLPYLNFEDEALVGLPAEDLGVAVEEYYRSFPDSRARETVTWCFDEIQVVAGWERFVRRLLDQENVEIFLSGSSAALLSREIATAMRGRAWTVSLFPFSFAEALRHADQPTPADTARLTSPERTTLEAAFLSYLTVGGFPEAQASDTATRLRLLHDYVDVAILRDVVERYQVANVTGLRWLVRQLLANAGGMFSVEKFHAALASQGIRIARDTVHELLGYLTDCFLVRVVWVEAASERRRMANPRKAYPVDPGLIPVFDRTGRANVGHALETAVYLELERRGATVTYVRTPSGYEVDFLARYLDGRTELLQVCADASGPAAERELRALQEARALFPEAVSRLLVLTHDGLPPVVTPDVSAETAYEWMLAGEQGGAG